VATAKDPIPKEDITALLMASTSRDQLVERIGRDVSNLAESFSRKLDEAERDTRKQFEAFQQNVANQFQNITTKFEAAMLARDNKLEAFSTKILESKQTPWALMISVGGFILLFTAAIGGLAYSPILSRTTNLERAMEKLSDNQTAMREFVLGNFVTQKDLEARSMRGAEDRERTNRNIEKLQDNVFPKAVHEQRWARFDTEILAAGQRVDSQVANLQREIDALQRALGDTYTARDVIIQNQERISDLEKLIRDTLSRRGTMP